MAEFKRGRGSDRVGRYEGYAVVIICRNWEKPLAIEQVSSSFNAEANLKYQQPACFPLYGNRKDCLTLELGLAFELFQAAAFEELLVEPMATFAARGLAHGP